MSAFHRELQIQQIQWAEGNGLADCLEIENGKKRWILLPEHKGRNLYDAKWLGLTRGRFHRWFRALNSSQAFSVNLFAPLVEDQFLAKSVFQQLCPHRALDPTDRVEASFEYHAPLGSGWLGEATGEQPTQADVVFIAKRYECPIGILLIEVKLSEKLGSCRGYKYQERLLGKLSPCLDISKITSNPKNNCWLVREKGRRYWELMGTEGSGFDFTRLTPGSACPFHLGGYQLMRNRLLADAFKNNTGADWADVGLCAHPAGQASNSVTLEEFRSLVGMESVLEIEPDDVISAAERADPKLANWVAYLRDRYQLTGVGFRDRQQEAENSTSS